MLADWLYPPLKSHCEKKSLVEDVVWGLEWIVEKPWAKKFYVFQSSRKHPLVKGKRLLLLSNEEEKETIFELNDRNIFTWSKKKDKKHIISWLLGISRIFPRYFLFESLTQAKLVKKLKLSFLCRSLSFLNRFLHFFSPFDCTWDLLRTDQNLIIWKSFGIFYFLDVIYRRHEEKRDECEIRVEIKFTTFSSCIRLYIFLLFTFVCLVGITIIS